MTQAANVINSTVVTVYGSGNTKAALLAAGTFSEDFINGLTDVADDVEVGYTWNGSTWVAPTPPVPNLDDETIAALTASASSSAVAAVNNTIQAETAARTLAVADLQAQIDALFKSLPINPQTGTSYTVLDTDRGELITLENASSVAVSIADAAEFGADFYGFMLNKGVGVVTVTPAAGLIGGASSTTLDTDEWLIYSSDGTDYQILRGGGSAGGGVSSFNSRTGSVSLATSDLATAVFVPANVAAGSTTDISAASTFRVRITGSGQTVTSLGTTASVIRLAHWVDANTITHNATSLICPGGANITTVADAAMLVSYDASGNARILFYQDGRNTVSAATIADNRLVRGDGGNRGLQQSGITVDDSDNVSGIGSITPVAGSALRTATSDTNTLLLQAYDTDGASYTTFATLTAGTTPTMDLSTAVTQGSAALYRVGGTDVALADGGTGASLVDPNADRIMFWDDSGGAVTWLSLGTGLAISGTSLSLAVTSGPTIQTFTASGTWTKPAGLVAAIVHVVGGGGSGGAADSVSSTTSSAGSGGGGGGYARKHIVAGSLGSTESVTVGAGGAAASAGANNGNAGGASSFGAHCTANGGDQGLAMAGGTSVARLGGGTGGTATGGDLNIQGQQGGYSHRFSGTQCFGGDGGSAPMTFGFGARGGHSAASGDSALHPVGYGAGSGGPSRAAVTGGGTASRAGSDGIVIVEEFYA